jgi:hypothetical protein
MCNERAIRKYCKGRKLQTGMMLTFRQMPNGEQKRHEVEQSNLVPRWLCCQRKT